MGEAVIVSGVRTAIGNFGGSLQDVPATELGAITIKGALKKAGLKPVPKPESINNAPDAIKADGVIELEKKYADWDDSLKDVEIDEVIMGNVVQAGQGQNVARQAMIYAGLPKEINAFTVNKVCASGIKSVALAAQAIKAGDADVIVAGGMENMSQIPYYLPAARWGARMNNVPLVDGMVHDGLWEKFYDYHMGITSENIMDRYGITREEQDQFALESNNRALAAIKSGVLKEECSLELCLFNPVEIIDDTIDVLDETLDPDDVTDMLIDIIEGDVELIGIWAEAETEEQSNVLH